MELPPESEDPSDEHVSLKKQEMDLITLGKRKHDAVEQKRSDKKKHKGYSVFFSSHVKQMKSEGTLPSKPGSAGKAIGMIWNSMTEDDKMIYHLEAEKMNIESGIINPQNTTERDVQSNHPREVHDDKREKRVNIDRKCKSVVYWEPSSIRKKRSDKKKHKGYSVFFSSHVKQMKSEGTLPSKPGSAGKAIGMIWNSMTEDDKMIYHLEAEKMNIESGIINPQNTTERDVQSNHPREVHDDKREKRVNIDRKCKAVDTEGNQAKGERHEEHQSNGKVKEFAKQLGFRSVSSVDDLMRRLISYKKKASLDLCLDKLGKGCKDFQSLYITLGGMKSLSKYPKREVLRKRIHDLVESARKKQIKSSRTHSRVDKNTKHSSYDTSSSLELCTSVKSITSELNPSARPISEKSEDSIELVPNISTNHTANLKTVSSGPSKIQNSPHIMQCASKETEREEVNGKMLKDFLAIIFDQNGNLQGLDSS